MRFFSYFSYFSVFVEMFLICSQSRLPDAISGAAHSMPALDTQWIETTSKKMALRLEKLDMDLKNYKSNSIKESIRLGLVQFCFCYDSN